MGEKKKKSQRIYIYGGALWKCCRPENMMQICYFKISFHTYLNIGLLSTGAEFNVEKKVQYFLITCK